MTNEACHPQIQKYLQLNADNQELKARLALGIAKLIEANGMTQTAAAELIGIQRTDLSKILRGKITASLERTAKSLKASGDLHAAWPAREATMRRIEREGY